jgi:ABC-type branched-subunit amino acid transport system permease subunit
VKAYLPFLVFGITAGSIYGLASMGLVLTYKTSGVFNFGHGAIGAASAYVFYSVRDVHHLPWPVAALIAVGVFGVATGLIMERLAVGLASVPTSFKIVATVGLLLLIRSALVLGYGSESLTFTPFLPQRVAFSLSSVRVTYENLVVLGLGVGAAIALFALFRVTRLGTAMRAVVDDPSLLDMTGASPTRVRRAAWLIGCCFASASGVLFASAQGQLDATLLSLLVVQAFGAAAIGAFSSLPLAYVGGLAVGLLQALVSKLIAGHPGVQGLDINTPFLVLLVVLLVMPRRKLVEVGQTIRPRALAASALPPIIRRSGGAVLLAGAVLVPLIVGARLPVWTNALSQVILFLSLGLLVRTSGQISLCHVGLAAVGAACLGHSLHAGLPWGIAVVVAGLVCVPVGALIAIPAIRLSGLYLGLATLGFGILLSNFLYTKGIMFGLGGNLKTSRPTVFGLSSPRGYYYIVLAIVLVAVVVVVVVERSRLGRLLRALADSPVGLTTSGLSTNTTRVIVFCISAFLAGVGGAVFASQFGSTNGDPFPYLQSLILLAVLAISGRATVVGAVIGTLLLYVIPGYIDNANVATGLQIAFGAAAILAALASQGALGARLAAAAESSRSRVLGPAGDRWQRAHAVTPASTTATA